MTKPEKISLNTYEELKEGSDKIKASSWNDAPIPKKTKLLIVGTITPPETKYFYCSYPNRIYGYIDEAIQELIKEKPEKFQKYEDEYKKPLLLKELKEGMSEYVCEKRHIYKQLAPEEEINKKRDNIKRYLNNYCIAFLDVMEKAIRKKNSSYDKDITQYVPAENAFNSLPKDVTIIANSKLTKALFDDLNTGKTAVLCSQRCDTKEKWIKEIRSALESS